MSGEHRGAKIGPRIAELVSQAIVSTHHKMTGMKHKLAMAIFRSISDEISDEVDTTIGPIIRRLAAEYESDGPAAAHLNFMGYGHGQMKAIAGSNVAASALTWALGTILNNELAPVTYATVGSNPHLLPDPSTVAAIRAIGYIGEGTAVDAIASNGLNGVWAEGLIELAKSYPGMSDLIDMLRRDVIGLTEFTTLARKSGVPADIIPLWFGLKRTYVSMQDAAVGYLRGAVTRELLNEIGAVGGYNARDIDIYLESIGEPPGTMELLEAYRRNFIDHGTLERGILQSRTRNEWIPVIEQLRYSPMSIADAVNASVQNHITKEEAARISEENGLEPGAYAILYETAGEPLSRTELNELFNRGEIGSDVVLQGLRESRLKDKYGDLAHALRRRLLEPRTIAESVFQGTMSHEDGVKKAMEHGFNAEDAATLVQSASARKTETFRGRIISAAETLYVDNAIPREELTRIIIGMGFSDAEADFAARAAEYHREARVVSTAVNAVRSKYVAHHLTEGQTSGLLDGIGIPATQRDYLLKLWGVEVAANTRVLTPAQIIKAASKGDITPDDAQARLEFSGYSADDAALLLGGL